MPDVEDAAPPRRKVRRREKERRPQRSLSAEPVKSLSDGEAAPAQTPLPRTPAAATPGRGAALFRKILTPKSAASNWRTLRQALATIGGDRAWYSLTRHQGGPSAEDDTAALLELSGIVHTCRVAPFGAPMPSEGVYGRVWRVALPSVDGAAAAGGAAPGPARIALLEQHDDRSLKIFRERVAIAIRGRATALVITEKMARLVDERRREPPRDALVDLNALPFPVVVLPESDNEFLRDEMPQWSNTRLDGWRDLERRCAAAGGAEPAASSLVAREALAAAHRGHWCFVQLGMVTHQRDSFVSLLGNGIARTFRRAAFADAGAARDFGAYGVMMEKLEARVENAMDVDRDAAGLAPAQRSPRVAVAAAPAPPATPLDEGAAAILKGAKDANGGGAACLMLCKRLLDGNEPWPDYATFLRTHVGALYPEIEYFNGQDLKEAVGASETHDAASRERSQRIESLCLVAKLFAPHRGGWNECKTGKAPLSDADLTFLRQELLERVVQSPQNDRQTRAEKLDNLFCYLACCTVGKIKAFADDVALETQLESVDHDLILRNAMSACPGLLPSYQRLDQGRAGAVYAVASTAFNLGQFLQGESLPASLAPLKHLCASDPSLLRFTLFSWIARVPAFTQLKFLFDGAKVACEHLFGLEQEDATVKDVYDKFLRHHARKLDIPTDDLRRGDRHLVRLCMMLRAKAKEVDRVRRALDRLEPAARALLVAELNMTGVDDGWAILVYYAPDLLRNILSLDKQNPDSDGTNGVMHGLVLLAKVFRESRARLDRHLGIGVYTVSVHSLASKAATKGMTLNRFLDESAFVLEHMGDEGLVNTKESMDHFVKSHPPSDHGRSPGRIRR